MVGPLAPHDHTRGGTLGIGGRSPATSMEAAIAVIGTLIVLAAGGVRLRGVASGPKEVVNAPSGSSVRHFFALRRHSW